MNNFNAYNHRFSKFKMDKLEIISEEIKKRVIQINKNITLIPKTYNYLLLEYLTDLSLNIYFSSFNQSKINSIISIQIDLFASISDTLNALHKSEKYNLIIRMILNTNSSEEISEVINSISFKIVDNTILAPKFYNNPLNIFSNKKLYLGSIGLSTLDKLFVFLRLSKIISKVSLYKYNCTRKNNNFSRKEIISDLIIQDIELDIKKLFTLAVLFMPSSMLEHFDSVFYYNNDNRLNISCTDTVISSNLSQYSEVFLLLNEQFNFNNIIMQHGIGYNQLEGDIRYKLEHLISDKWIGWEDSTLPSPKLSIYKNRKPIYTSIIFPRNHKFSGRDLISCDLEEINSIDKLFTSSVERIRSIAGLQLNTHLITGVKEHEPRINFSSYLRTKGQSYESVLNQSSSILCIGVSTTLIEAILSPVPTIWLCPTQLYCKLKGYLLSLYEKMSVNGLVFSEKSDISRLDLILHPSNYRKFKQSHAINTEFLKSRLNIYNNKKFIRNISDIVNLDNL